MANKFYFGLLTQSADEMGVISTCLGTGIKDQYDDKDVGKAVKMGTSANHVFCEDGDDIEGFIDNIDAGGTENEGYTFGGVSYGGRHAAVLTDAAALLDYVVAADQPEQGVQELGSSKAPGVVGPMVGLATVRKGDAKIHHWRILHIFGDGKAGDVVVLGRPHRS